MLRPDEETFNVFKIFDAGSPWREQLEVFIFIDVFSRTNQSFLLVDVVLERSRGVER